MKTQTPFTLPVLIVGAGAWGTALAVQWARRAASNQITLLARDEALASEMRNARVNAKYLPNIKLPENLDVLSDPAQAFSQFRQRIKEHSRNANDSLIRGLVVLATPVAGLEQSAKSLAKHLGPAQPGEGLLWLSKGLLLAPSSGGRESSLQWPHEIVAHNCPGWPMGALSGPSFAQEVAASLPVALSLASHDLRWARAVAHACHGDGMRLYATSDLIGVEVGGAMKNVLAIASGVCDGLSLGANARAALLTRGLAEMARLGMAVGAKQKTFLGLATLGDLILTATGDLSRNRKVGLALAKGESVKTAVSSLGHVAEGVLAAPALLALAQKHQVEVPLTESVCMLIDGKLSAKEAIIQLMSRDPTDEHPESL